MALLTRRFELTEQLSVSASWHDIFEASVQEVKHSKISKKGQTQQEYERWT
jgi:hypothetical protein